jgi:hypothetical protein
MLIAIATGMSAMTRVLNIPDIEIPPELCLWTVTAEPDA